jgi:hypothetical protein
MKKEIENQTGKQHYKKLKNIFNFKKAVLNFATAQSNGIGKLGHFVFNRGRN